MAKRSKNKKEENAVSVEKVEAPADMGFIAIIVSLFVFALLLVFLYVAALSQRDAIGSAAQNIPVANWVLPLANWLDSPMYFLLPLLAFFLAFWAVGWINSYFETKAGYEWWLLALVLGMGFTAFFVNLGYYYGEVATLNSTDTQKVRLAWCFDSTPGCDKMMAKINGDASLKTETIDNKTVDVRYLPMNYFQEFRQSVFGLFLIGLSFGWLARLAAVVATEKTAS